MFESRDVQQQLSQTAHCRLATGKEGRGRSRRRIDGWTTPEQSGSSRRIGTGCANVCLSTRPLRSCYEQFFCTVQKLNRGGLLEQLLKLRWNYSLSSLISHLPSLITLHLLLQILQTFFSENCKTKPWNTNILHLFPNNFQFAIRLQTFPTLTPHRVRAFCSQLWHFMKICIFPV